MLLLASAPSAPLGQQCEVLAVRSVSLAIKCVGPLRIALLLLVVDLTCVTLSVNGDCIVMSLKVFFKLYAACMVDVVIERRGSSVRGLLCVSRLKRNRPIHIYLTIVRHRTRHSNC